MAPLSAAQSRAADSTSVLSTVCRSNLDRLISLSTSAVALCCSSASSSSRRSLTTSVSWPEADELLWRTAFGAFALRLRVLASLLLTLERRRIAHPKGSGLRRFSNRDYSRDLRPVEWVSIKLRCKIPELRMSGNTGNREPLRATTYALWLRMHPFSLSEAMLCPFLAGFRMKCPACEHENAVAAKFCEQCAAPLARQCANCAAEFSATANFCPQCGHPVGFAEENLRSASPQDYTPVHLATKTAVEGERKQVTVMFAD